MKTAVKILGILNIVLALAIAVLAYSGAFREIREIQYVAADTAGEMVELRADQEVIFPFHNTLDQIDDLILKFTDCADNLSGELKVSIYDNEGEYYHYSVPADAFKEDLFYLIIKDPVGMKVDQDYFLKVSVAGLGNEEIVLHCVKASDFEVVDGEESPFWGVDGRQSYVSEQAKSMLVKVAILDLVLVAVVILLAIAAEKGQLVKLKEIPKYTYVLFGVFVLLVIISQVAAHLYSDSAIEETDYEIWSVESMLEIVDVPLTNGEVVQSFQPRGDYLREFILFFDNYRQEDDAHVEVVLEDEDGNVYYTWGADTGNLSGDTFCMIADVQREVSRDQEYFIKVSLEGASDITVRSIPRTKNVSDSIKNIVIDGREKWEVFYFEQGYTAFFYYDWWWSCILGAVFLLFLAIIFSKKEITLKIWDAVSVALSAPVSYYCVEILSGHFKTIGPKYAIGNCLLLLGFFLILRAVFYRGAFYITSIIALFVGLLNHFVLQFRGTSVLLADVKSASTAMSVAGNYGLNISPVVFTAIFVTVCMVWVRITIDLKRRGKIEKQDWHHRAGYVLSGAVLLGVIVFASGRTSIDAYTVENNFPKYGWGYSNLSVWNRSIHRKKSNYSDEKMEQILAEIEEPDESGITVTPKNLIVIMNESFSDLGTVGELKTNRDYMPFIHGLDENTIKGNLYVSTYGGNTCITEWEFLTGNSQELLPAGSIAYTGMTEENEPGMASILHAQNYYTVAMHPYGPANWNRDKVYPAMGFEEFLSFDDFHNLSTVRNFVSDKSDYQEIIDYYENFDKEENLFIFNVTMQNHGGYDYNNGTMKTPISIENFDSPLGEVYLSLVYESDRAFEYLLDYFSKVEEPTMIVMFGDHLPALPDDFYEKLYGKSLEELNETEQRKRYITPYIVWTNYDSDFEGPADISTNFLGEYVLQCAGLEMSEYDKFLLNQREKTPVLGKYGVFNEKGDYILYEDMPEGMLENYEILQYLRMSDRKSKYYRIFEME